jgi:hypothetical protein
MVATERTYLLADRPSNERLKIYADGRGSRFRYPGELAGTSRRSRPHPAGRSSNKLRRSA